MKVLLFIIALCAVFVAYVRYLERVSVFYPDKQITDTPTDIGLSFDDVVMETEDGVSIHGWFIKHPQAQTTVLFFHGNAGNLSYRLEKLQLLHELGLNVLIVDYRGYGKSQGHPTEAGLYKDALAAYDTLIKRSDVNIDKIIAYGVSLGGVVAIDLALKRKVAALWTESTLTSAADMAKRLYPFIPSFLIRIKMDNLNKIAEVNVPKLMIHSQDDSVVPFEMGQQLFDTAREPKTFMTIQGGHNDGHVQSRDQFMEGMRTFLKQHQLL